MKSIYIYSPYWSTFGGGEKYVLSLSVTLAKEFDSRVILLSSTKGVDKKSLERFSNSDLSQIEYIEIPGSSSLPAIVGDADCFICQSNVRKFVTNAKHHVQIIQIPYKNITPISISHKMLHGQLKESIKDISRAGLLSFARDKADVVLTYSKFVHDTLENNFKIHNKILHPPIQDYYQEGYTKKNIILSVGRLFAGLYNNKRYDIMTEAFRRMCASGLTGWEYHIIGTAASDDRSQKMIRDLKAMNQEYPVIFHINESFDIMKQFYNEASIFWHGAGYGVDETQHPENVEHFGMTTVEAMSAKCIPVVVNRGGQREIVIPGKHGFLWEDLDELISQTYQIIRGDIDVGSFGENARKRFHDYDLSRFGDSVKDIFNPFLS